MTSTEDVAKLVRRLRPNAKFVTVSHSSTFIDQEAQLGEGFYYANLYDEAINANLSSGDFGFVLVENTYLVSMAYNLFFSVLYCHRLQAPELREELLRYNLKKTCAEQLYRQRNGVLSRALLLETLLYEEGIMRPVIATQTTDPPLATLAMSAATNIMLFTLTQHELGHYYARTQPAVFQQRVRSGPSSINQVIARIQGSSTPGFLDEFLCDLFGIYNCLDQKETRHGPAFTLRAVYFAYAAYAVIYALAATAEATAALWPEEGEEAIDFQDISVFPRIEKPYRLAIDQEFVERARLAHEVCDLLAADCGVALYGNDDPFPLVPSLMHDLFGLADRVFDCDDQRARNLAYLVARAFHNHDEGMEYLYLRSKTFRTNRAELNL